MKNNLEILGRSSLFHGMEEKDIVSALECLQAQERNYEKNTALFRHGDHMEKFGLVLDGSVLIRKIDFQGNTVILTRIMPGELFGEAFACGGLLSEVDAVASGRTRILWLDYQRILFPCENVCQFHRTMMGNLIQIFARKNVFLTGRIQHLSRRTLREKVLSYLSEQAKRHPGLQTAWSS